MLGNTAQFIVNSLLHSGDIIHIRICKYTIHNVFNFPSIFFLLVYLSPPIIDSLASFSLNEWVLLMRMVSLAKELASTALLMPAPSRFVRALSSDSRTKANNWGLSDVSAGYL